MKKQLNMLWSIAITIIMSQVGLAENRTLVINHLFVYKNPMVNYQISVQGKIPIEWKMKGVTRCWGWNEREDLCEALEWNGNGKVDIRGRGSMNPGGGFTVDRINYDSSMSVSVKGIQRYLKAPKERGEGSIVLQNLELQETWDGKFDWDIKTSDPKNDSLRLNMLKMIVPQKIPDSPHTGKTVEFDQSHLENATYEYVTSNSMGTFRWRYILTPNPINVKEYKSLLNDDFQENFDEKSIKPSDYRMPEGRLGPPLDQIEWDLVDINDVPAKSPSKTNITPDVNKEAHELYYNNQK